MENIQNLVHLIRQKSFFLLDMDKMRGNPSDKV